MKSLLILTGKPDWILSKLLPSLFEAGQYTGNALIINYGDFTFDEEQAIFNGYNKKVLFSRAEKIYQSFTADRFRAYEKTLRNIYNNYDVVWHVDGNDIEFFGPVQELLDMAQKQVCVVPEPRNNDNSICKAWVTANSIPKEYWDAIGNKPVLNCGVFAGPSKTIYQICNFIAKFSEHDSRFGIDQLLFNALFYYYKVPFQMVDRKWDYHFYDKGIEWIEAKPYTVSISDLQDRNSAWINFDYNLIHILHYAGPQPFKIGTDRKIRKPNWLFH